MQKEPSACELVVRLLGDKTFDYAAARDCLLLLSAQRDASQNDQQQQNKSEKNG